ncbi:hypothetical protein FPANT_14026 [Fusarium pseudoanthophilum]|uniref:Uncharacterized protein n=1 Tax=Fusarium pseudoanthophilum TaxID=48495 RepID=A0A8H5KBS6_9HYPO|nr:hypothetical protein FPANT_14026 [Fusarium pseudoanthophilum]
MQVLSPEPDLILPPLFICLVLTQRSLPIEAKDQKDISKGKVKEKVQEEVEKSIKKLADPAQDFFYSAQDHLKHPTNPFTQ